jgi:methylenetetrahydrofolate dehydrogenase (NADP+)/methenyltetrahydrofolate cyclohydrolase
MAILIDGKALAKKYREEIAVKVLNYKDKYGIVPGLAVVLVGEDPASQIYVSNKEKMSLKVGMNSKQIRLPADTAEENVLNVVKELNEDDSIHGILVQLPLPKHIDTHKVLMTIKPEKDVDGFHPVNVGKLLAGLDPYAIPCTPLGIIKMLEEYNIDPKGKEAVIIGRSNIVGKPVSILLLEKHATVTICHSRTKDINEVCHRADILVAALGREKFVKADWVKEGAVIIDVGMNRDSETNKLCGDVDFEAVKEKVSYITPVPGGVGPMTIAMLLLNTLGLYEKSLKIRKEICC